MSLEIAQWTALAIGTSMTLLWGVSVVRRDSSIVDWLWAPGFALIAWVAFLLTETMSLAGILVLGLVSLWAVRLGGHLFLRNLSEGEDPRYAAMRKKAGRRWWWSSYVTVFLLQAGLIWLISAPIQLAIGSSAPASGAPWLAVLGGGVALAGLVIEGIADAQLKRFRAGASDHQQILSGGLWRYSRHPNYFGDALFWWGLWLIVLPLPYGLWTIFSPLLMTFLLVKVSGVPMLERGLRATKPGYEAYAACTSAFIPWFPKKGETTSPSEKKEAPQRPS